MKKIILLTTIVLSFNVAKSQTTKRKSSKEKWDNLEQAKSIVAMTLGKCKYVVLENSITGGCIVAEWIGGSEPRSGNVIVGNLAFGQFKEFYNSSRKSKTLLWIDESPSSRDMAIQSVIDKCAN